MPSFITGIAEEWQNHLIEVPGPERYEVMWRKPIHTLENLLEKLRGWGTLLARLESESNNSFIDFEKNLELETEPGSLNNWEANDLSSGGAQVQYLAEYELRKTTLHLIEAKLGYVHSKPQEEPSFG